MARSSSSRGRSPQPPLEKPEKPPTERKPSARPKKSKAKKDTSYKSDGVEDNDVFLLPVSDYLVTAGLTLLATAVRVWKISQPTSVVFDEVQ